LDPWDKSILKYYEKPAPLKCLSFQSNASYLENGYLKVNREVVPDQLCEYRYITHGNDDDFNPNFGEWKEYSEPVKLENDVIEVRCRKSMLLSLTNYNYIWSHVVPKEISSISGQKIAASDPDRPSVIMFGLDSMSRSNFIRQLPKTYAKLNELEFQTMDSHVKIGDNTYRNLIAVLTGKRGTTIGVVSLRRVFR
jgi:hypothetical protein